MNPCAKFSMTQKGIRLSDLEFYSLERHLGQPLNEFDKETVYVKKLPTAKGMEEFQVHVVDGKIERFSYAHPHGITTDGCAKHLIETGQFHSREDLKAIYDIAEKTLEGEEFIRRGSVDFQGSSYQVTIDRAKRRIIALRDTVLDYATRHAVERAKERYGLILTAQTAKEMMDIIREGKTELHREKDGNSRLTLEWDLEKFTVVTDGARLITVTPLGG